MRLDELSYEIKTILAVLKPQIFSTKTEVRFMPFTFETIEL